MRDREKGSLDARERVLRTLAHRDRDRMARGEILVEDPVIQGFLRCGNVGFPERLEFFQRLELDIVCVHPRYRREEGRLPEADGIRWPDLGRWVEESGLFVFALMDGPFGWGMRVFGWEKFLTLPLRDPDALRVFLRDVTRLNEELASILVGQGIDGLLIADDVAYQRGLFTSPRIMRTRFLPSMESQVEEGLERGLPVFFHSDGNVGDIVPDLIRIGFRGLHCIDPNSGMEVLRLMEAYGEALCLWGHLTPEDVARWDDPAHAQRLTEDLSDLSAWGGCILGTTCGIFGGLDLGSLISIHNSIPRAA
ncbi:MAG: hypothetical protein JW821_19465 [Deltaproteobacteria bacterium]|nr:hypothetical protein [Deltaproteobacteria bacterium]